jgi:hypothetical protein
MSQNDTPHDEDEQTEYEYTLLLDGMGGQVEADSEAEAKRKALEQARDRLDDLIEHERNTKHSSRARMFVQDLRPRNGTVELHELTEDY